MNNAIHSLITVTALLALSLGMLSCDDTGLQGSRNDNQAPNTSLTVDEVNRSGDNRLISQIRLNWWGDDPDGYVTGFEYRINESDTWSFTTRNDSVFTLPIPQGQDTSDVNFQIRAVDNDGFEDPTPAELILPIKNSTPTVSFRDLQTPPDTTYEFFGVGWNASDPDGANNLNFVEIAINDSLGPWLELPISEDFIHIQLENNTDARIFFGTTLRDSGRIISGFQLNSKNTLYIRVFDQALQQSEIISHSWFIKEQRSNTLVLHDDNSTDAIERLRIYQDAITDLGYGFDLWDISSSTNEAPLANEFPATINPTLTQTLSKWDHIIWFSNDLDRNFRFGQEILSDFFDNNGKLLAMIPAKRILQENPILNFLPILRSAPLGAVETSFLLTTTGNIVSESGNGPVLNPKSRLSTITPFEPTASSTPIYTADFLATRIVGRPQPYSGPSTVAVKNPEGNFLFFGFEPADVAEGETLRQLFDYLLSDELNIQPQTP